MSKSRGIKDAAWKRVDLGIALASRHAQQDVPMTHREIAAFCGCSPQTIVNLEQRAMDKVRKTLGLT